MSHHDDSTDLRRSPLISNNNNTTEQEVMKQTSLEFIISKTEKNIKEKFNNRISFAHFKPAKNGRLKEELTDDGLIKRAFRN